MDEQGKIERGRACGIVKIVYLCVQSDSHAANVNEIFEIIREQNGN